MGQKEPYPDYTYGTPDGPRKPKKKPKDRSELLGELLEKVGLIPRKGHNKNEDKQIRKVDDPTDKKKNKKLRLSY